MKLFPFIFTSIHISKEVESKVQTPSNIVVTSSSLDDHRVEVRININLKDLRKNYSRIMLQLFRTIREHLNINESEGA